MAQDDWKRRREKEDEEEELARQESLNRDSKNKNERPVSAAPTEKLDELIQRSDVLIEQLNNLYNMYVVGVEKSPPTERRKQLDQMMLSIQMSSKPTAAILFKCSGSLSRYNTHRERWEKMIRDLESGKIKRRIGSR